MDYFDLLPTITYQGISIKDISISIVLDGVDNYLEDYQLMDGEDVYDVAYKLYGKDELFWIIYLVNPEFPFFKIKTTQQFSEYISNLYKGSGIQFNIDDKRYSDIIVKVNDSVVGIDRIDRTRNQIFLTDYIADNNAEIVVTIKYPNGDVSFTVDGITATYYNLSRQMTAYYLYNGEYYIISPNDNSEKVSWEEYEISENEKKRTLKVIPAKYVENVISEVNKFVKKVGTNA